MKVRGMENTLRNLAKLDPKKWKRKAMADMRASQRNVRSDMRTAAPRDSGKLKRSIRTQAWTRRRAGEIGVFVRTGPILKGRGRVWYAHFPELGTDKYKAFHFVKDAYDSYKNQLIDDMKDIIYDVVRKANGR